MSDAPTTESLTCGISHVGLAVSDLQQSFQFFESLGFKKVGGVEAYPSMFVSDGIVMLTLWQTEDNATPFDRRKNVGLHHLAIRVPSLDALQKAFDTAMAIPGTTSDFSPQKIEGTPLTHAMVFEPSGNRIEFTHHAA
jgi:catechol 2,3-dioxygenase-like lactoylglutathione lyase family enzyme